MGVCVLKLQFALKVLEKICKLQTDFEFIYALLHIYIYIRYNK